MEPIIKHTGIGVPLRSSNVDTDQIIPAVYLKRVTKTGFDDALFANWRKDPEFILNQEPYKHGSVLVAGPDFGTGSSREHAPVAIAASGIPVVIAASFARIFYRNGINIGLPLLEIGDDVEKISAGDRLRVDTETGTIENLTTGDTFHAHPLPGFVQDIARAGGLLNYIKENGGFRHGV